MRVTTEEVELSGVKIPKDALVFVLEASANHDKAYFSNPQEFDPHREHLSRHMTFGRGIHFCLGAPLVRLETRIALELLIHKMPKMRLAADQELHYGHNLALRGLQHLLVEWD